MTANDNDELITGTPSHFPSAVIVVRFVPDDSHASWFPLVSIQPIAQSAASR